MRTAKHIASFGDHEILVMRSRYVDLRMRSKKWRIVGENGAVGRCNIFHIADADRRYNDPDLEEIIEESATRTVVRKLTGCIMCILLFRVSVNYVPLLLRPCNKSRHMYNPPNGDL